MISQNGVRGTLADREFIDYVDKRKKQRGGAIPFVDANIFISNHAMIIIELLPDTKR